MTMCRSSVQLNFESQLDSQDGDIMTLYSLIEIEPAVLKSVRACRVKERACVRACRVKERACVRAVLKSVRACRVKERACVPC